MIHNEAHERRLALVACAAAAALLAFLHPIASSVRNGAKLGEWADYALPLQTAGTKLGLGVDTCVQLLCVFGLLAALPMFHRKAIADADADCSDGLVFIAAVVGVACLAMLVTSLRSGADSWDFTPTIERESRDRVVGWLVALLVALPVFLLVIAHQGVLLLGVVFSTPFVTRYLLAGSHYAPIAPIWYPLGIVLLPATLAGAGCRYLYEAWFREILTTLRELAGRVWGGAVALASLPLLSVRYVLGTDPATPLPMATAVAAYVLFPLVVLAACVRLVLEAVPSGIANFVRWLFYGRV